MFYVIQVDMDPVNRCQCGLLSLSPMVGKHSGFD